MCSIYTWRPTIIDYLPLHCRWQVFKDLFLDCPCYQEGFSLLAAAVIRHRNEVFYFKSFLPIILPNSFRYKLRKRMIRLIECSWYNPRNSVKFCFRKQHAQHADSLGIFNVTSKVMHQKH